MQLQVLFSAAAIGLTLAAFGPYLLGIVRGRVRPHMFSWVIWGLSTLVIFFAQLDDAGGVGAWPIGLSALISLSIALLAWRQRADNRATRSDWWFFGAALASLPLWYLSSDPLAAVLLLTVVDLLGFGPTLRKAYHQPFDEQLTFFALVALRNVLVVLALEHHSLTTVLFPAVMAAACVGLIGLVGYRRTVLSEGR